MSAQQFVVCARSSRMLLLSGNHSPADRSPRRGADDFAVTHDEHLGHGECPQLSARGALGRAGTTGTAARARGRAPIVGGARARGSPQRGSAPMSAGTACQAARRSTRCRPARLRRGRGTAACQRGDTPPASATAHRTRTNTGSASAAGGSVIAGPISSPPYSTVGSSPAADDTGRPRWAPAGAAARLRRARSVAAPGEAPTTRAPRAPAVNSGGGPGERCQHGQLYGFPTSRLSGDFGEAGSGCGIRPPERPVKLAILFDHRPTGHANGPR